MPLFPAFLNLAGRTVLLVGGGRVAAAKLGALLEAGARVTVVAPEVCPQIEQQAVSVVRREFRAADLDGVWFVVAAAPPHVNRDVAAAAEARQVCVNAVDDPAHATAFAAGVLRRGGVTVAISTDGHAPALAGLLREAIDAVLPPDLDRWLTEARRIRPGWIAAAIPMPERRPLLLEALCRLYARPGELEQRNSAHGAPAQRAEWGGGVPTSERAGVRGGARQRDGAQVRAREGAERGGGGPASDRAGDRGGAPLEEDAERGA